MPSDAEVEAHLLLLLSRYKSTPNIHATDTVLDFEIGRARRFMLEYAEKWHVDLEGLNYAKFLDGFERRLVFPDFSWLLRILSPKLRQLWRDQPARPTIKLAHLINVARLGKWHDPAPAHIQSSSRDSAAWFRYASLILEAIVVAAATILAGALIASAVSDYLRSLALVSRDGLAALSTATRAALFTFVFVFPMYLRTQQSIRERFGMHWDFWRSTLKPIQWTPVD